MRSRKFHSLSQELALHNQYLFFALDEGFQGLQVIKMKVFENYQAASQ